MTNKSASTSALLSLIVTSLLTFGMPSEALARGDGHRPNANRPHNYNGGNRPNRPNRPYNNTNINHNSNNNININVDGNNRHGHGYNNRRYNNHYNPVGTAVAVTAAAVITAAVVGSIVNANQMQSNCVQVVRYNTPYMQCGNSWYQPQYQGNTVTYVVINQPY